MRRVRNAIVAFSALLTWATSAATVPQAQSGGDRQFRDHDHSEETFRIDYLIVGGGPSGLVLAEQLSRDPEFNVVLLEAGPDGTNEPLINTPASAPILDTSQYVWNYTSQPDPNIGNRAARLTQGFAWGGGSAVNYMQWCTGAASVFDEWAELSGNQELKWSSHQSDYRAMSHYVNFSALESQFTNAGAYGDGPVEITNSGYDPGADKRQVQALRETLNLPIVDLNDGTGIGVTYGTNSIRASNRTRDYALPAYGWQMAQRGNVQLVHSAWVSHIGFDGKRAMNVTYHSTSNNAVHTLAAREMIVSAGALNSPKLLMLSGVGPADHLKDLDIPVVLEYEVNEKVFTAFNLTNNTIFAALAQEQYNRDGGGYLGVSDPPFAVERVQDSIFQAVDDTFHPSLPSDRPHVLYQTALGPLVVNSPNISIASAFIALVQPEASGFIRLNSSNFRDDPLIYSNYYGSPGDKAAILYGYKRFREVWSHPSLQEIAVREVFPGKNVTSDEDLWQAIQQSAQTFHHVLGTVALGRALDSNWRIKGLDGIRVVDSSTFPSPPTCHTQASAYAMAHAAARAIKRENRKKRSKNSKDLRC